MDYLDIVNIVFSILYALVGAIAFHYIIFAIVGIFKRKTYPQAEEKLKYGLIIPARNEEAVVGNLIKSIQKNNYPQDKLHIFVIAHNCNDKTAEIARLLGATVYEYNNPKECTMGYAFKYLFSQIEKDYGVSSYDGFFLFNADNILDENYFSKMNDAFIAHGKKDIITSFRNSKNFGENTLSACYGIYFLYGCLLESKGRSVLNCSTRVQGTGYVISSELVKNGWNYVTLTEDWEFTADQIIGENKIYYCDEAVFYDEQPTTLSVMWRQRVRWCRGRWLVCLARLKDLLKSLFTPKRKNGNKNKFSVYDMTVKVLPVFMITSFLFIARIIAIFLAPVLFPAYYSFHDAFIYWLVISGIAFGIGYVGLVLSAILVYFVERKRIKNVRFSIKLLSCLVWPLFLALATPAEFVAVFSKNLGWKTIPHKNTTSFEDLNNVSKLN